MANDDETRPLKEMVEAFQELANSLNAADPDGKEAQIELGPFSRACSLFYPFFRYFPPLLRFAELDYVAKVEDLSEASKSILNLSVMITGDIQANCVQITGSHTRNLLRLKRSIDFVKVLFEQILVMEGNSLLDPISKAYAQVFGPHHLWAVKKDVTGLMCALPTKDQLLKKVNEDENSASILMQSYVASVAPIVTYIDQLFISRELGIDW